MGKTWQAHLNGNTVDTYARSIQVGYIEAVGREN